MRAFQWSGRAVGLGVIATVLILSIAPAAAQNLLANGTFDQNIEGWSTSWSSVTLIYHADVGNTLSGGSGPGCLEVWHANPDGGSRGATNVNIVSVSPGETYTVSGAALVPDSEDNIADRADFVVFWFDAGNQYVNGSWLHLWPAVRGKWLTASRDVVAPAGAVNAMMGPVVTNPHLDSETRPGVAFFDDLVFMVKGATTATQDLFIPASASAHGKNGTFWTTTGWFANNTSLPVTLKAAFLKQGQDNTAAMASLTEIGTIPASGFLEIKDLAAKVGGAGLSGAIYIRATATADWVPSRLVDATTYTFTPNPSGPGGYGQGVPAVGVGSKSTVFIPGLYQGNGYRTNIGILNTSAVQFDVKVWAFDSNGTMKGQVTWTLRPYEQKQVGVTSLSGFSVSGGYVVFSLVGNSGSFQAYATVVDQETGDAVYTAGF
ncbi:MAG: hypothetical protein GXP48_09010 [Acidobacteria bacterium]|nr:hypothetical protein [Acidobacteriota bacterium]